MTEGGRLYSVEAEYIYDGPQFSCGDINADFHVDLTDFSIFHSAWLSKLGDSAWNPYCDINSPEDYVVDWADLKIFCDEWLTVR
jgi:hypothetical protein